MQTHIDDQKRMLRSDLVNILKMIQRKVLKGRHLLVIMKEIKAGYLTNPHFKDIYIYLAQNKLPSSKVALMRTETLEERYLLLGSLLFRLNTTPDKEAAVFAIQENFADILIMVYHSSLFGEHQSVIETYLAIHEKFYIPHMVHYLRAYINDASFASYIGMRSLNQGSCTKELTPIIKL